MKLLNFKGSGLICLGLTLLDFSLPVNAAALPVDRNTGLALPVDRPTGVTQPVDIIRRKLHARATSEVPTPRILEEDPYLLEIFTLRIWEYWSQKDTILKDLLSDVSKVVDDFMEHIIFLDDVFLRFDLINYGLKILGVE